jgi:hypothetical protein
MAGESCDGGGETAECDTDCTAAECGDATVNLMAGEACDDGGESAACDADCTPAECGDAWLNLMAGEACDGGGETAECDTDCSPTECGDGWMNIIAGEACDDAGESMACDTDCTAAECGDATVNWMAGESCDDGGESAACDTDCSPSECGDGWMNITAGEACDDAGLSATCTDFCTLSVCGDGVVNPLAGEECDSTDPDCLSDCTVSVGMCHTETDWGLIADSLFDHDLAGRLPVPPDELLAGDWGSPVPDFILHDISPSERFADDEFDTEDCIPPLFWDDTRIELGGYVTPTDEDEAPYCRIQASPTRTTDPGLYFMNRARPANNAAVTGEPTWITLRYPIPTDHEATSLTYTVNWSRLFGSHPDGCTGDDVAEDGSCIQDALYEDEVWDEEVPPGLYLLWGKATDCTGWEITGPHEPAGTTSWSATEQFTVDVPESLQDVDELVVSMLVYHQYPGGCDGSYCVEGRTTHSNLGFVGGRLVTEKQLDWVTLPPPTNPRLFGHNEIWLERLAAFDELACSGAPDWGEGSSWGGLTNVRNVWDQITKGGAECLDEVPESLFDISDAADYIDGTAADDFDVTRAVRMLHLIRREMACRDFDTVECHHDLEAVNTLAYALIDIEMDRIHDVPWSTFGFGFDLRTREPMRVYTLLYDVLWGELDADQRDEIQAVTGEQIDAFLEHFYETHWSIYNGNNWTPVLAEGAVYWGLAFWDHDERAPEVVWRALESLWLHRDSYLEDGVYNEGLLMYSQVSFDPLMNVSQMVEASLGIRLESIPWERMEGFSEWAMAFMGPDGSTIDFGDSWSKRGWGTFMPLLAHMAEPDELGLTREPDPCFTHRFFSNKYYYHGLADPWNIHPALAKDWPSIVSECDDVDGMLPDGVEVAAWGEGGWGSIRIGQPGATDIASSTDSDAPARQRQADQVMLAISAIPNSSSHTEMDFGTVVWVPYGSRILWDFGYGTLHSKRYETAPDHPPDQNPTGHSTLIIPEALLDGDPSTNTSQIDGRDGTIEKSIVDGHEILLLDGSAVYGRDDPSLGWLKHFHRRVLPLESGHMILMDDFTVRDDRPDAMVSEYWYTQPWLEGYDRASCLHQHKWVERIVSDTSIQLYPACSGLENDASESAGHIEGIGLEPGGFVDAGELSFINRLDDEVTLSRMIWEPDAPVRRDLRLFALLASPGASALPIGEWEWVECDADICAELSIDGEPTVQLGFTDDGLGYALSSITSE